jgi:nucleoid-associated protein YgaU
MAFSKAYFEVTEGNLAGEKIEVQFNPTDLNFSKTAQFAEIAIPGLDSPVIQYVRGGTQTLTIELFFDTTDEGMGDGAKSVTELTHKIYRLVKQDSETHAPPRCVFTWGSPSGDPDNADEPVSHVPNRFTGIVENVDRKFLLFSPEGVPLRARLTVKMREYKTIEDMASQLQSADHTKTRILTRGLRLDQIAAGEYGNPVHWRTIAEENDIDDPRMIPAGTMLEIPPKRMS